MEVTDETANSEPSSGVELRRADDDNLKRKIVNVSNDLRSDSTKTVYKALHYVRMKVIDNPKGIVYLLQCGGTKAFYKILMTSNLDILNVAVSLLGNLCSVLISNDEFCDEMIRYEVASKVTTLLRKSTEKRIQRRICRLVGNMAQCHALGRDLHKAHVATVVNSILSSTDCLEVKLMGLRALRWLWVTDKAQLIRIEAVKTVAAFLDTDDHQIFKLVIRSLIVFTQPCNSRVAQQLVGAKGNGYGLIVSKLNDSSVNVLILNLSNSPEARVELCKAGAVQAIVARLNGGKLDSYLITALCAMCREPMVRASLRKTPEGFKTLLSLLVNPKAKHFYPELLKAVSQFNYDTPSLMMMVKGGLIGVLVERLEEFARAYGQPHVESVPQMAAPQSPSSPSSSRGSLSPPPSYPFVNDPAMYSPRCSTPESETPSSKQSVFHNESSSEVDTCILEVLSQLTYQGTPLPALASKTTITTLLNYIVGLRYPQSRLNFLKAAQALSSIVKCKNYFNALLEEETIVEIDKSLCRAIHNDCWECRRLEETGRSVLGELGTAAQSGLGEGELAYRLATASEAVKTSVAIVLPHIVEQPNLLSSLLFGHHALRILLSALQSRAEDAVASLHTLFTTLGVINPQGPVQSCQSCNVSSLRKESNISFQLDDGSIVHANREALSHGCPMFEAMFRGGFLESQQTTVQITDISPSCLTHLARVIDEYCVCALPKDHATLLEMVTASDRFLLPDLTAKIMSVVMSSALTHLTAGDIFAWGAAASGHLAVAEEVPSQVVKYLLTADMTAASRAQAVEQIACSRSAPDFLALTTDIVKTCWQSYAKNYKFSCQKMFYIL